MELIISQTYITVLFYQKGMTLEEFVELNKNTYSSTSRKENGK